MAGSTRRRWTLSGSLIALGFALAVVIGLGVLAGAGAAASLAQPVNISPPTISGTPQKGATLTGTRGTWGNSPTRYDYFWRRCNPNGSSCSNIGGARSLAYTLKQDDVGHTIRLRVKARNSDGSTHASSGQTAVITAGPTPLPQNTVLPTIKGTPRQGQTLRGDQGKWTGSPTDYNDFWVRCDRNGGNCANILGANNRNGYILTSADVGHAIRFKVEAKNAAGSTFASSVPTAVIVAIATPAPRNTSPPTISGSPRVGSVLTIRVGAWSGTQPITYRYQWLRCDGNGGGCVAIAGAVGTTWRIVPASVGHRLRARVTATNLGGSTPATSTPTAIVTGTASPPPTAAGCPAGAGPVNINSIKLARAAADRQAADEPVCRPPRHEPADRPLPRHRLRRPLGAGCAGLRDGRAVQPALDPAREADQQQRLGRARLPHARRLPGQLEAAADRDLRPGTQARRERPRRHLHTPPLLRARQPAHLTALTKKGGAAFAAPPGRLAPTRSGEFSFSFFCQRNRKHRARGSVRASAAVLVTMALGQPDEDVLEATLAAEGDQTILMSKAGRPRSSPRPPLGTTASAE